MGPPGLSPDQSAALRDRLLGEIATLPSAGERHGVGRSGRWPPRTSSPPPTPGCWRMPSNCDCPRSCRPKAPSPPSAAAALCSPSLAGEETIGRDAGSGAAGNDQPARVDKSTLAVPTPRRYRNKAHLRYVAQQPCLLCGRKPSDPHHLRFMQPRALGRKASDEFAVPLCRIHHRLVHRVGNEAAWWKEAGIDPIEAARKLWESHASRGRAEGAIPPKSSTVRWRTRSDTAACR